MWHFVFWGINLVFGNKVVILQSLITKRKSGVIDTNSGLIGFDSELRWYVSTRSIVAWLLNIRLQQINWRNFLRSRCLVEV